MSEKEELQALMLEMLKNGITEDQIERCNELVCRLIYKELEAMWFTPPDNYKEDEISIDENEFLKIIEA